jgi:hypothetical protein
VNTIENLRARDQSGYCLVKYEDVLQEPDKFIHTACRCLGLDIDHYPFEQIDRVRVIGSSNLAKGKVTWRHLRRPDDFRPTEYWRRWSQPKKFIFKAIAGRSLIKLGYENDLKW